MSQVVSITEAKAQLSKLVEEAINGGTVVIGRGGKPAVMLVPCGAEPEPRRLGGWRDQDVWIAADFDDPLSSDF